MSEDFEGLVAAILLGGLLAVGVIVFENWDSIRCHLPELPAIHRNAGPGPTPLEES